MRHWTHKDVAKLVAEVHGQLSNRPPEPFPGRYPTRVAWYLVENASVVTSLGVSPTVKHISQPTREYFGKPSQYRAIALIKHGDFEDGSWLAEIDRGGLLHVQFVGKRPHTSLMWQAFRPSAHTSSLIDTWTLRTYLKRIGGHPLYSLQKRLSQTMIDSYYAWYQATFGVKLHRPRKRAATNEMEVFDF